MTPETVGRRPITVVELQQPNQAGTGVIRWLFMDARGGVFNLGDYSNPDDIRCDPLPCLLSVSTSSNEINAGSNMDGRSPLGVTGKVTVTMQDFAWNRAFGDEPTVGQVSGKAPPVLANFWALWTARHDLFNNMFIVVYDGYEGQSLDDMRKRLHVLDSVDGPNGDGKVTLKGLDPMRLAGDKKAEFPRTSSLDLYGDISATDTSITLFGLEDDLSDSFGNTGAVKYFSIGSEIIRYMGYTDAGNGRFALSGVVRGALGTNAEDHSDLDKVQRAGRYEKISFWLVLEDLFKNHTAMPHEFIPVDDWNAEGNTYLPTYKATRTVVKPTVVSKLAGEITQQGLFYIWWAEYEMEIKMLAIRAPDEVPIELNDESHLMRGTVLKRDPSMRTTQVAVYYNQINPFTGDSSENFKNRFTAINGDNEGETRVVSIYAPWITNRTQAVQLAMRLLIRYRATPLFLSVTIDAKDREATVGKVVDITTRTIIDPDDGSVKQTRWQVISAKEIKAGHTYALNCQTYEFLGKFGRYMADGSPNYPEATDEQKRTGAFYAGDDGLLSDGKEGYKYQ